MKPKPDIEDMKFRRKLLILIVLTDLLIILRFSGWVFTKVFMSGLGGFSTSFFEEIFILLFLGCFYGFPILLLCLILYCIKFAKINKKIKAKNKK